MQVTADVKGGLHTRHDALDGFAAIKRFNGLAIAVGSRIPGEKRLAGPRDVRAWLQSLLVS